MNKKNIATTIVLILCTVLFTVVGSTFMNFIYPSKKITVKNPKVVAANSILVFSSDDQNKTQLNELEFNSIALGLKPATGELDSQTGIPSTITDKQGTEGLYAAFSVSAPAGLNIVVKNINIGSSLSSEELQHERENMYVALKDQDHSAQNLDGEEVVLITEPLSVENKEYTIFFWLGSIASEKLEGSTISFELHFLL